MVEHDARRMFRVAGACAAAAVALAVLQTSIEVWGVALLGLPVPTTAEGWLMQMNDQRLFAATAFTTLEIPMFVLSIPVFIALYRALEGVQERALLAGVLGVVGVAVFASTNTATAMLDISDRYAIASDPAQRAQLVAAGEAVMAVYQGPGLSTGVVLVLVSVGIFSLLMWRHRSFGPWYGRMGAVSALTTLAYFAAIPWSDVRIYLLEVGGALFIVWLAMVGRRLWVMARPT